MYSLNSHALDGLHASDLSLASHTHDHAALTGLSSDDHPQYFNLSQNESVTGIPAFNGGTSGVSAPFSVDSTDVVTNLNADLLDGQHGSAYALASHTHNASDIAAGTLASGRLSGSYTGVTSVGTLTSLSVTGNVTAGGEYNYSSAKTRYYSIGASEFVPGDATASSAGLSQSGVDRYIATCSGGTCSLVAPIHVPQGATMSSFSCKVYDNSPTYQVRILWGWNSGDGNFSTVVGCDATTGGESASIQTITNTSCNLPYNNQGFAYLLRFTAGSGGVCGSNCRIHSCTITYTQTHVP
jgi:hypothetical protein